MDGSEIERGWMIPASWYGQQRTRQVIECTVGAVRVDVDRVLLSLRFGSCRLMCRGDTDWHLGTAGSLASGRYQSRFVITKSHIRISDLPTGLHDPTFHSTCYGRLRRLLRRHALQQAAAAYVHILSRSLCMWSSCMSTISLLGCSTSVALATGPTEEEDPHA